MIRRSRFWALYGLFFVSGATTLVYEVLWLRGFSVVLGSTVYSMSCVLTAFMAGLAIGAAAATRVLSRASVQRPSTFVRIYGVLELVIGLYGLVFTLALFLKQEWWVAAAGHLHESSLVVTLPIHFLVSFSALLIPTACMGATLPLLVMALERDHDAANLYAFNTFGAAAGSLVTSFVLIYQFGVVVSTFIAAAVHVLILAAALWVAPCFDGNGAPRRVRAPDDARPHGAEAEWTPTVLFVLSLFSGFIFFTLELVWNRVLSIVVGNRVYVMSITLATVLACLGIGAWLCKRLLPRYRSHVILVGSYAVAALSLCAALLAQPGGLQGGNPALLVVFLVAGIPVPAIATGMVFPLLLSLPAVDQLRGVHVGRLYGINTVGAMMGALLTGYVLFSTLGSNRILIVGVAMMLISVALLMFTSSRTSRNAVPRFLAAAIALTFVITCGLRWNTRLSTVPEQDTMVLDEDAYGIFSIESDADAYLSVRNNRTELVYLFGDPETQYVQESEAHLPLFFSRRRARIAVVGSGYGITAGAASKWPGVATVDAVEILPLMVEHADLFSRGNYNYHRSPNVRVHVADGRQFLAASSDPYDVISINMSDPYLSGSSSLFSTEFYDVLARALAPGGVACQHIFGPDTASLYHGFKRHFRYVVVIPAYANGVSVLGSQEPLKLRNMEVFLDATLRAMLAEIGLADENEIEALLARGAEIKATLDSEPPLFLNSDVNPVLEFRRSPEVDTFFSNL